MPYSGTARGQRQSLVEAALCSACVLPTPMLWKYGEELRAADDTGH